MHRYQLLLFLFFVLFAGSCFSGTAVSESKIVLESKDKNGVEFSVVLPSGLSVKHVVFKQAPITKKWLLIIKRENVEREQIDAQVKDGALSQDEFSIILESAIEYSKVEFPDNSVDQVQTSISLVANTWQEVVGIVKSSTKDMVGAVSGKNEKILADVVSVLLRSNQMSETCTILSRYSYRCDDHVISINPIVFKDQYINHPWDSIANVPDAGLSNIMWFGVNVRHSQNQKGIE